MFTCSFRIKNKHNVFSHECSMLSGKRQDSGVTITMTYFGKGKSIRTGILLEMQRLISKSNIRKHLGVGKVLYVRIMHLS